MKIDNYYQPYLIFQQNKEFIVKGSEASASLNVSLFNDEKNIKAKVIIDEKGAFKAIFPKLKANTRPYTLLFTDGAEKVEIKPIYCGDLYLFVGQSNVSLSLKLSMKADKYKSLLKENPISYLSIEEKEITKDFYIIRPSSPLSEIDKVSKWRSSDDEEVINYSALGLMFSSLLKQRLNYPVGFISVATGGLSIDSLLSKEVIKNNKEIYNYLLKTNKYVEEEKEHSPSSYTVTSGVYNEKIAPLKDIKFKSAIYYQGENSAVDFESGRYFERAIIALIDSYRELFNDHHLSFFLMGIADEYYPYGDQYGYQYITEALSSIAKDDVYLVPIYDIKPSWNKNDGDFIYHPIHPTNKEDYAKRLLKFVYYNLYQNKHYLPLKVNKVIAKENYLLLDIECHNNSLKANESYNGFYIAGEDKVFYASNAYAVNQTSIKLETKDVIKPRYYSYGLMQYSYLANCKSKNQIPLLPSRSLITKMDKKHYQINPAFTCDKITLIENNFGADIGGGFPVKLWEKSSVYPLNCPIIRKNRSDKTIGSSSLELRYKIKKNDFGFFAIKCNLGYAGLIHPLGEYRYLYIDIKGDKEIEFCGALFRVASKIKKMPLDGLMPSLPLDNEWRTYSIDLNTTLDGAGYLDPTSKDILNSLSSIEFYFRSKKETVRVLIDNIRFSNNKLEMKKTDEKKKEFNKDIILPGGKK